MLLEHELALGREFPNILTYSFNENSHSRVQGGETFRAKHLLDTTEWNRQVVYHGNSVVSRVWEFRWWGWFTFDSWGDEKNWGKRRYRRRMKILLTVSLLDQKATRSLICRWQNSLVKALLQVQRCWHRIRRNADTPHWSVSSFVTSLRRLDCFLNTCFPTLSQKPTDTPKRKWWKALTHSGDRSQLMNWKPTLASDCDRDPFLTFVGEVVRKTNYNKQLANQLQ